MSALRRLLALPEEVQFFGRIGVYGVGIGIVYWFLTYEVAGTVLLIGFGLATGILGLLLFLGRPRGEAAAARADTGPFIDESGRVPSPTYAPLEFGFGVALLALAPVFGLPMAVASIVPLVVGGVGWLRSASAEWRRVDATSATAALPRPPAESSTGGGAAPAASSGPRRPRPR